jgi:hypothetical protein
VVFVLVAVNLTIQSGLSLADVKIFIKISMAIMAVSTNIETGAKSVRN